MNPTCNQGNRRCFHLPHIQPGKQEVFSYPTYKRGNKRCFLTPPTTGERGRVFTYPTYNRGNRRCFLTPNTTGETGGIFARATAAGPRVLLPPLLHRNLQRGFHSHLSHQIRIWALGFDFEVWRLGISARNLGFAGVVPALSLEPFRSFRGSNARFPPLLYRNLRRGIHSY